MTSSGIFRENKLSREQTFANDYFWHFSRE